MSPHRRPIKILRLCIALHGTLLVRLLAISLFSFTSPISKYFPKINVDSRVQRTPSIPTIPLPTPSTPSIVTPTRSNAASPPTTHTPPPTPSTLLRPPSPTSSLHILLAVTVLLTISISPLLALLLLVPITDLLPRHPVQLLTPLIERLLPHHPNR